jgi:16S rRNA (cytosine967-C5)-methyltransferase
VSRAHSPPSETASQVNPGRRAALRASLRVEGGERSDQALEREAPREGRDRALAWHLLHGSLQHRAQLDHIITKAARRGTDKIEPVVLAVLRIAIYELRFGRAPARAVVHQGVELARLEASKRAVGFVNAVLRNQHRVGELPPGLARNHPAWLLERWEQRYGAEATERWALSNNEPPPLCIATAGPEAELDALFAGLELQPEPAKAAGRVIPGMRRFSGPVGPVTELPGAAEGLWWVQDAAAAAVADLLGCRPGWRVLDACAAPGGKTFRLVSQGGNVVAVDRSEARLEKLTAGLDRLGMKAETAVHDWLGGPLPGLAPFDAVLVDAPCSGLGTIRRHPEIRWRRRPDELAGNAARQLVILETTAAMLATEGVLVYAVCSAEPEEGEAVVRRFLRAHEDFVQDELFCSAPPVNDEDAFWAARLIRR